SVANCNIVLLLVGFFAVRLTHRLLGEIFRQLHIGLVEGMNADCRSGSGDGKFPAEKFLAEVVFVLELDARQRMAIGFESCRLPIEGMVFITVQKTINKKLMRAQ